MAGPERISPPAPRMDLEFMDAVVWVTWRVPQQWGRSILVALLIAGTILVLIPVDPWMALLATVMLFGATQEALLPLRYELTSRELVRVSPLQRRRQPWAHFERWESLEEGFQLLGSGPTRWHQRRRSIILWDPPDPEAVAGLLEIVLGLEDDDAAPEELRVDEDILDYTESMHFTDPELVASRERALQEAAPPESSDAGRDGETA